jgi:hypothetical protein
LRRFHFCSILPPAAMAARASREKEPGFAAKTARNKGLGAGLVPSRGSGKFAANYQDAVKGVLTLRRPATMAAQVRGFGPPPSAALKTIWNLSLTGFDAAGPGRHS